MVLKHHPTLFFAISAVMTLTLLTVLVASL